jgi:hypothetical protein
MTSSEYDQYLGQHSYNHMLLGNRRDLMRQYPRLSKHASKESADNQIRNLESMRKENVKANKYLK